MILDFRPSVSYRWDPKGGAVRDPPLETPTGALTRHGSVLLLFHGYNNDQAAAVGSYRRLLGLMRAEGPVHANIMAVHWPGDGWTGPAFYMSALKRVRKELGPLVARDLARAARGRGHLRVDVVAHSLGCRLTLETVHHILGLAPPGIALGRVVFMAAAVPTYHLGPTPAGSGALEPALARFGKALSLYSDRDTVLRVPFRTGQALARDGAGTDALGRRRWPGGALVHPNLTQTENTGARHSDYWGSKSDNEDCLQEAARLVRGFMDIGPPPPRTMARRKLPVATVSARPLIEPRALAARAMTIER